MCKYEVYNNTENQELSQKVAKKLKVQTGSVPFVVIGEKSIIGFSSDTTPNEIKNILNDYSTNPKNYKDIVAEVKNSK